MYLFGSVFVIKYAAVTAQLSERASIGLSSSCSRKRGGRNTWSYTRRKSMRNIGSRNYDAIDEKEKNKQTT